MKPWIYDTGQLVAILLKKQNKYNCYFINIAK